MGHDLSSDRPWIGIGQKPTGSGKARVLSSNPKILLCTVYRRYADDYLDYIGENVYLMPRVSLKRKASPGLRFLKQNVPELEILEYPLWHEYVSRLKEGWDVVGFSFFQNEIAEVSKMAEEARRMGVKELWAGGYGALDPAIPKIVDRVFYGAAEDDVAQAFGKRVPEGEIEHPVMFWPMSFEPGSIPHFQLGLLYTQHGCPFQCTFCQTPVFDTKHVSVNMESIERVLAYYRKIGVSDVLILDELFGYRPKSAEEVTRILARHGMRWWAQSRAQIFTRYLDAWYERGLRFPLVGVEVMSEKGQESIDKRQRLEEISEFLRRTGERRGMYRMAYYMIGYPQMSADDAWEDVIRLKQAGFDAHQVNVVTPFPATPLWDELKQRFGIFDRTYRHYDAKYLVWRHPKITSLQIHYLRNSVIAFLNKPLEIYGRRFVRLIKDRFASDGFRFIWRDIVKTPMAAAFSDPRKQVILPLQGK